MKYYPTHVLKILRHKKILHDRLSFLFHDEALNVELFLSSLYAEGSHSSFNIYERYIPALLKYGYISTSDDGCNTSKCSLLFNQAICLH